MVDLPGGQTLFALLRGVRDGDGAGYHARLFNQTLADGAVAAPRLTRRYAAGDWAEERREARRIKPQLTLPPLHYPMLVRFRDVRDPKSVEAVDAGALDKSFGAGVKLRRIVLAVTDDPVTSGIENWLGWLSDVGKTRSTLIPNPPRLLKDASAIQLLGPSAFGTELYK